MSPPARQGGDRRRRTPFEHAAVIADRVYWSLVLAAWFVVELFVSSLRVAWDVLTPRHRSRPGIVAVPLEARTDLEITLVANLVSLTPGTLTLDVSPPASSPDNAPGSAPGSTGRTPAGPDHGRHTLYVHMMFVRDVETDRRAIREGPERFVLRISRGRPKRANRGEEEPSC